MKKGILMLIGLVTIFWGGATYYTAEQGQKIFTQSIQNGNAYFDNLSSIPLEIELISYQKGFLSSQAQSKITVMAGLIDEPLEITLDHTIHNGPLLMNEEGVSLGASQVVSVIAEDGLSGDTEKMVSHLFHGENPFIVKNTFRFDNQVESSLSISTFKVDTQKLEETFPGNQSKSDKNGEGIFSVNGMEMHLISDQNGSEFAGDFAMGEILMEIKEEAKQINLLVAESHGSLDIKELYRGATLIGRVNATVPEIYVEEAGESVFTMKNMTVSQSMEPESSDDLNGAFDLRLESVEIPGLQEIPESLSDMQSHFHFSMKGVSKTAIKKLIDAQQSMNEKQMIMLKNVQDEKAAFDQEIMAPVIQDYLEALSGLIKKGTETAAKFEMKNQRGIADLSLSFDYTETKPMKEMMTLHALIQAFAGTLTSHIDNSLVEGTPLEELLGFPIAMGFAVAGEEATTSKVTLTAGTLDINGHSMPVIDMLGAAGNSPLPWVQ